MKHGQRMSGRVASSSKRPCRMFLVPSHSLVSLRIRSSPFHDVPPFRELIRLQGPFYPNLLRTPPTVRSKRRPNESTTPTKRQPITKYSKRKEDESIIGVVDNSLPRLAHYEEDAANIGSVAVTSTWFAVFHADSLPGARSSCWVQEIDQSTSML